MKNKNKIICINLIRLYKLFFNKNIFNKQIMIKKIDIS